MKLPCIHCGQTLTFGPCSVPGHGESAWRHPNGEIYQGHCECSVGHTQLYNPVTGDPQCYRWRDDHCALPDRSERLAI